MSKKWISGCFLLALGAALAFGPTAATTCSAQGLQNQPGKAWRKGTATEANMVQLIIDNVQKTSETNFNFTGKVSIRINNQWMPNGEAITGTGVLDGDYASFRGTAQVSGNTYTVRGFYTPGADDFSTNDDRVFIYYFNDSGPETDPCDPDDEVLGELIEIST